MDTEQEQSSNLDEVQNRRNYEVSDDEEEAGDTSVEESDGFETDEEDNERSSNSEEEPQSAANNTGVNQHVGSASELFSKALARGPSITAHGQLSASQIWGEDDTEALRFAGLVKKRTARRRRRRHKNRKTNRMYRKELPPELTSLLDEGTSLWLEGKTSEAIEKLTNVANQAPKSNLPYLQLGIVYDQLDNREKALEMFTKATSLTSDDLQSLQRVAELAASLGKKKLAINALGKLMRRDPENKVRWMVERAALYSSVGAFKRAQDEYETILAQDPRNTLCMIQHALQHELKGNREGAVFELTDIVQCVLFPFRIPIAGGYHGTHSNSSVENNGGAATPSSTTEKNTKLSEDNLAKKAWVIEDPDLENIELNLRLGAFRQLIEILLKAKHFEKASGLIVRVNKFLNSGDSAQNRSEFMWSWQRESVKPSRTSRSRSISVSSIHYVPEYPGFEKRPLPLDISIAFATCCIYTDCVEAGKQALSHLREQESQKLKPVRSQDRFALLLQVGVALLTVGSTAAAKEYFAVMEEAVQSRPDLATPQYWLEFSKFLLCSVLPRSSTLFDHPDDYDAPSSAEGSAMGVSKDDASRVLDKAFSCLVKAREITQRRLSELESDQELNERHRRYLIAELLQTSSLITNLERAGKRGVLPHALSELEGPGSSGLKKRKNSAVDSEDGEGVVNAFQTGSTTGGFWQEPNRRRRLRIGNVAGGRDTTTKRKTRETLEAIELKVDQLMEKEKYKEVLQTVLPLFQYLFKKDSNFGDVPGVQSASGSGTHGEVDQVWHFARSVNVPIQWEHRYDGHVFSVLGEERTVRMVTIACQCLLELNRIESAFSFVRRVLDEKGRKSSRFADPNMYNILELTLAKICFYQSSEVTLAHKEIFSVIQRVARGKTKLSLNYIFELLNYAIHLSRGAITTGDEKNFVRQLERLHAVMPPGFNRRLLDVFLGNFFMPSNPVRALGKYYGCHDKEHPNPLILLCMVQCYTHMVFNRKATSRHALVAKAMQWLGEYAETRLDYAKKLFDNKDSEETISKRELRNIEAEVKYNLGRAHQEMGMECLAVANYEKVLETKDLDGNSLKREAAHNLALIFRNRGDLQGAYRVTRKYLVV